MKIIVHAATTDETQPEKLQVTTFHLSRRFRGQ